MLLQPLGGPNVCLAGVSLQHWICGCQFRLGSHDCLLLFVVCFWDLAWRHWGKVTGGGLQLGSSRHVFSWVVLCGGCLTGQLASTPSVASQPPSTPTLPGRRACSCTMLLSRVSDFLPKANSHPAGGLLPLGGSDQK